MISILIPIYNGIEFIEESVFSVINQTYTRWELLIAINGHEQNSDSYKTACALKAKLTCEIQNKIRIFDFYTKGKANTLNGLIPYCSYKYVALLDVDDVWHNRKLEIQVPFLTKYDVIGSKCVYFGNVSNFVPNIPVKNITFFNFFKMNPIINSSCIIRKEFCYWNPDEFIEDYDLWLRLRKLGKTFYNCPQILVKHRIHEKSSFNSTGKHKKIRKEFLEKHKIL
jgi:glycosyltransferase involved in cell wall biosynthesis